MLCVLLDACICICRYDVCVHGVLVCQCASLCISVLYVCRATCVHICMYESGVSVCGVCTVCTSIPMYGGVVSMQVCLCMGCVCVWSAHMFRSGSLVSCSHSLPWDRVPDQPWRCPQSLLLRVRRPRASAVVLGLNSGPDAYAASDVTH